MNYRAIINGTIILMLFTFCILVAQEKAGEQIDWQVISSGGIINGSSGDYNLNGTVSQTAVGGGTSANYNINQGFWQDFGGGGSNCCLMPGDANDNGSVNILDVTFLISYLYKGGAEPFCFYEADANANCTINILDVTYLISYLYKGGPPPDCAADCSW